MIIAFGSKEIREICEDGTVALKRLGTTAADELQARLADVRAAESIADLLVGNPRISDHGEDLLTLDLESGFRLRWVQNHLKPHYDEAGRIAWHRTRRVKLIEIVKD